MCDAHSATAGLDFVTRFRAPANRPAVPIPAVAAMIVPPAACAEAADKRAAAVAAVAEAVERAAAVAAVAVAVEHAAAVAAAVVDAVEHAAAAAALAAVAEYAAAVAVVAEAVEHAAAVAVRLSPVYRPYPLYRAPGRAARIQEPPFRKTTRHPYLKLSRI
jgi:hypothetical protein